MEKNEPKAVTPKGIRELKVLWPEMSPFERFEYLVMMLVSFILTIVILVALWRLVENVYQLFIDQMMGHTGFEAFQVTFGMLLTLFIAFEFRNSIEAVLEGKGLLFQAKIVVLIAIIALARKFLVLDSKETGAEVMVAYAAIALSMGVIYWLLSYRKTDNQHEQES